MNAIATEAVDPSRKSTDRRSRLIAAACATGALLVAAIAITGYASGDLRLASFAEDGIVMRPNAIVSVLTSSGAVLLLFFGGTAMRRLATLLASFVLLLAFLTLCEYLFHVSLGIDNLLFTAVIEGAQQGVRMPHLAVIKFLLLGCALLLLAGGGPRSAWAAQTLGAVVSFIAMLSALGFTFGVEAFYSGGFHTDASLPTTIACFLLSCAVMVLRANSGWTKVMFSPAAGGIMLRRMLPLAVLMPWALAWLSLAGARVGYYT